MNKREVFLADTELKDALDRLDREELRAFTNLVVPNMWPWGRQKVLWLIAHARASAAGARCVRLDEEADISFNAWAEASARCRSLAASPRRSARSELELARLFEAYLRHRTAADRARTTANRLNEEAEAIWQVLREELP